MLKGQQARTAGGKVVRAWARRSSGAAGAALALLLLAFASPALAGPPTHLHKPVLDITGFDHACGAAVDSEGDIYVASAGEAKIRIFDLAHTELTSISNANEPCGLAVDSKGNLYVSEKATGKVVRYAPNSYPFSGTPIYGAPVTIDSSGEVEGISVDPFDDRLYVAKGSRIDTYDSEGRLGIDEAQRVLVFEATGGTFKLTFEGQETGPIAWDASHVEVQAALEALTTIGAGSVSVTQGPNAGNPRDHLVTFKGALGQTDVEALTADTSNLTGGSNLLILQEVTKGFSGEIGKGDLSEATGVAAYTYKVGSEKADRYVFAADAATDQVKIFGSSNIRTLKLRRTIDGPKPGEDFGFGPAGAYIAVDPGNRNVAGKCASIDEQACTAGHFLVYDDAHAAVEVFEANGEHLTQIPSPEPPFSFEDAEPTAIAVDRSSGSNDGTIYVTSGAGPGAALLAFGPLAAPSRPPLPELSNVLPAARAVATDSEGNVYVAAGPLVHVYGPNGEEIEVGPAGKGIPTETAPLDLAVDSTCKVYMLFRTGNEPEQEKVQSYTPTSCPPKDGTQYSGPAPVADGNSFPEPPTSVTAIGVNPANDHIFVTSSNPARVIELGSAAEGSPVLDPCFACSLSLENVEDIEAYGANGNVYISQFNNGIWVVNQDGTEVFARIGGGGSLEGPFVGPTGATAVDQSNGHVLVFRNPRGAAEEYDASGAFVTEFAFPAPEDFSTGITRDYRIAIDNSGGPAGGNAYVAFDDTKANTPDLWAFGPLSYGEPPFALTGIASGLGAGSATLHGSVNPRGVELESCSFEYLTDAQYLSNGETFTGAASEECAESPAEIGKGTGPVAVHADIGGLDPDARYRFRLFAENKYGASEGKAGLFGPPLLTTKTALPILYEEATLRAEIDPSGLATKYHFEYGTSEAYGQSTPVTELPPGDGSVAIEVPLTGLAEGTKYHFRIVVENEAKTVEGPDQTLETRQRAKAQECPNAEFRTGLSANLPDCRAYELVTPAETRGATPSADPGTGTAGQEFNNWLVAARGEGAGESIAYFVRTLPGFEGTGKNDAYRALRVIGEGPHPKEGWVNELFGPTYAQAGGETEQHGIASDQRYGFFDILGITSTLDSGRYLRIPAGVAADPKCNPEQPQSQFELVGCGSLGIDPNAEGRFLSAGGAHVIFSSPKHLEPEAALEGTVVYDRAAGSSSAKVVSVKPGGAPFGAGENAEYVAASEDGSAVAFKVGGTLYLHRAGTTIEVAAAPNAFAGISEDGTRVFYAAGSGSAPANLFACDVEVGPCVGAEPSGLTEIAQDSIFVNVSPDGSRVYFTSEAALSGAEENEAGKTAETGGHNLYTWDGTGIRFVAILDPQDFESFDGFAFMNLLRWTRAVSAGVDIGRGNSPTRSTPDGKVFVFQSHAQLTSYDNEGHGEIYRYEPGAAPGEQLACASCDPTGAPASADALLQVNSFGGVTRGTTMVPNLTDDGEAVFFQSPDRLLPEDANGVEDVYEWKAQGEGCERPDGCLALISSGQGEAPSHLYGMSADGRDVFFVTTEKLVGADVPGSPSMYDAREGGGIPEPAAPSPCQGDACQGRGSAPPALPPPATAGGAGSGNVKEGRPKLRCPKGKRKVRSKGRTRCVNKHRKKGQGKQRHKKRQGKGRAAR